MSITTYEPLFTYAATAGIGSYNTSLIQPGVQNLPSVASWVFQYYPDLFEKLDFVYKLPSASCPTTWCESYLFVGDLTFIQPTPSQFNNISTANGIFVHQLQGLQVDMLVLASGEVETSDCKIWGNNETAIQICIAKLTDSPNALVAGNSPHTLVL